MASWNKGKGKTAQWLRDHVSYDGAACLIWPFSRNPMTGYPYVSFEGRIRRANRVMCELAHGAPPSPKHQAAHSCGNGHDGCIHPRHLSWKTNSENQLDRHQHGTITPGDRWRPKLTDEEVAAIRDMKGKKTQDEIAAMFGITFQNVSSIHRGKSWVSDAPRMRKFTSAQIEKIRSLRGIKTQDEIAAEFGIHRSMVCRIIAGQKGAHCR